jgi:hypothetical protein
MTAAIIGGSAAATRGEVGSREAVTAVAAIDLQSAAAQARYCSSLTCSIQSTTLPSSTS